MLAVAYFIVGRASLLLAIPPGYATAIWPAAGLALAVLYVYGPRLWPAVVLGSAAVNIQLDAALQPDWVAFAVPLAIGLGAGLQALVGREALQRTIGSTLRLDDVKSVLLFVLVGCGLTSVISASVGVAALIAAGAIAVENAAYNWFTWWVGDGLGVMVFATIIFVYTAEPRSLWRGRRRIIPPAMGAAALVMVSIYVIGSRWEQDRQQADFDRLSGQVYQRVKDNFDRYLDSVRALRGLFESSQRVDRNEFSHFANGILARQSGFQALAFNRVVHEDEREAFEQQLSDAFGETRVITQRDSNGVLVVATSRRDYVVIDFIEPLAGNLVAPGYDVSAAAATRRALIAADARDGPAATDPLRLVQEKEDKVGVVVYLPVRRSRHDGPRQQLVGYVAGVFRIHDLMAAVLPDNTLQGMHLQLWRTPDGRQSTADSRAQQLLFSRGQFAQPGAPAEAAFAFTHTWPVQFADQSWQLVLNANRQFELSARSIMPWVVLATGMLFTGLLGMALLVLTGQHYRAREVGRELNRRLTELRETQQQLIESEKMASLSGLVAGFAHELNTPLGVAVTAQSTFARDLETLDEQIQDAATRSLVSRLQEASRVALNNIERAAKLVTSFKAMAVDRDDAQVSDVDLQDFLQHFYQHSRSRAEALGHRLSVDCPPGLIIRTVARGLTQVVANLVDNCLTHAFAEYQQGHIILSAKVDGEKVVLRVTDDGLGIPDEALEKVFEPFYTTSRGRGGTGLGLHLVYNIVRQQLGGRVRVISGRAHPGCCVEVVIPRDLSGATPDSQGSAL